MLKKTFSHKLILRTGDKTDSPALSGYGFAFDEITEDGIYGKEKFAHDVKIDFPKRCFLLRDHDRS